jgi:hypothetical protein
MQRQDADRITPLILGKKSPHPTIFIEKEHGGSAHNPGGQVKLLHPWPGQNPPPMRRGKG